MSEQRILRALRRQSPQARSRLAWLATMLACGLPLLALAAEPARAPAPAAEAELAAPDLQPVDLASALAEPTVSRLAPGLNDVEALRRFYRLRQHQPAWSGARCELYRSALLEAIDASASHGLRPQDYHQTALQASSRCDLGFELLASDAWLLLGAHLHSGRVDPLSVEPDWTATRPGVDLEQALDAALDHAGIAEALADLAPQDGYYAELREVLAAERLRPAELAAPVIDPGPSLRQGDSGPRVAQLRARLRWLGALAEPIELIEAQAEAAAGAGAVSSAGADAAQTQAQAEPVDPESSFDAGLELVIRELQQRANLEPDGVVGAQTLALLSRNRAARIDQLRVNLERWRWLPRDLGERHIRVNIANFSLEARAGGRIEQVHPVIVGSRFRRTPSFSAAMRYIVLDPWWELPRKLAVEDKLPLFRRDPGAFSRLGFELLAADGSVVDAAAVDFSALSKNYFPYRLRQRPGPANALGRAKLILPNRHSVYLHDTPSRGLFSRVRRDFSSGCIRVENVLGLVEWALAANPGWDASRITSELAAGDDRRVDLLAPIPVHLLYLTVVADAARGVRYLDDLYGRDPAVLAALDAPALDPAVP